MSEYVAMNIKKDNFIPMTEMDVKHAKFGRKHIIVTARNLNIGWNGTEVSVKRKIRNAKPVQDLCKEKWQKSFIVNSYIYTCCAQCHVRVMREDQIIAHQPTGAGLLSIGYGCIIKTEELTIYPHKTHTSEVRVSLDLYTPTIAPINHIINISIPS